MKFFFYCLIAVFLLSSCATHSGMMTGNASISDANFKVIGLAAGQATTTQFLGIGGLNKDALVLEAKRNLYQNTPLTEGQALANVTVDFKRSLILVILKTKAIVSAEIIDFNTTSSATETLRTDSIFRADHAKDWAMIKKGNALLKAKILHRGDKKSTLLYENNKGIYKTRKRSNKKLFFSDSESDNYNIGDMVSFHIYDKNFNGKIIAINNKRAIIEYFGVNSVLMRRVFLFSELSKDFATN